jgi:hypothetical protein
MKTITLRISTKYLYLASLLVIISLITGIYIIFHLADKNLLEQNNYLNQQCSYCEYCSYCQGLVNIEPTLKMYNKSIKGLAKNGLAFTDEYYVVWTKNRTYCDIMNLDPHMDCINETAFHELVHIMIAKSQHFCK